MFAKSVMTILVAGLSAVAMACPNLSGTFECNYEGEIETMTVSQSVVNGVTHFNIDGDVLIADGNTHQMPNTDPAEQATYRANCAGAQVNMEFFSLLFDGGNKIGQVNGNGTMSLDGNSDLVQDIKGTVVIDGQGNFPIDQLMTCQRI